MMQIMIPGETAQVLNAYVSPGGGAEIATQSQAVTLPLAHLGKGGIASVYTVMDGRIAAKVCDNNTPYVLERVPKEEAVLANIAYAATELSIPAEELRWGRLITAASGYIYDDALLNAPERIPDGANNRILFMPNYGRYTLKDPQGLEIITKVAAANNMSTAQYLFSEFLIGATQYERMNEFLVSKRREPILHRDIKRSNYVVTADGKLVCIDFNTAGIFDTPRRAFGSLLYVAPEMAFREKIDGFDHLRQVDQFNKILALAETLGDTAPGVKLSILTRRAVLDQEFPNEPVLKELHFWKAVKGSMDYSSQIMVGNMQAVLIAHGLEATQAEGVALVMCRAASTEPTLRYPKTSDPFTRILAIIAGEQINLTVERQIAGGIDNSVGRVSGIPDHRSSNDDPNGTKPDVY